MKASPEEVTGVALAVAVAPVPGTGVSRAHVCRLGVAGPVDGATVGPEVSGALLGLRPCPSGKAMRTARRVEHLTSDVQRDLLSERAGESFLGETGRMAPDLVAVQRILMQLVDRTRNRGALKILEEVARRALRDGL